MRVVSFAVILSLLAVAPGASQPSVTDCANQIVSSLQDEHGIPGVAVAVIRDTEVVYKNASGVSDIDTETPVTSATVFQLSSSVKLFTGVLIMRLVEQGQLDLDAPITRYLSDAPRGWEALTLRHCLTHSCGLYEITKMEGVGDGLVDAATATKAVYANSPAPSPGDAFEYSNTGFMMVARVVENVTGKRFAAAMREEVFEPAGMTSTSFWGDSSDPPSGAATGYYPDDAGKLLPREFNFPTYLWAAGGLASTIENLIRFNVALVKGELIHTGSLVEMWESVRLNDGSSKSYGLGWDTKTHAEGMNSAGHEGGMLTTFRMYPAQKLTVIVLTNGFTQRFNPDVFATAVAAAWEPAIIGLDERPCSVEELEAGEF